MKQHSERRGRSGKRRGTSHEHDMYEQLVLCWLGGGSIARRSIVIHYVVKPREEASAVGVFMSGFQTSWCHGEVYSTGPTL